ncbi:MAG: MFS transporter [Trebonia sp.]
MATAAVYFGLSRQDDEQRSGSWRTLGNRNFRYYFAGSVTSDLGTWLQYTAQVLLAYRLSHSVLDVGLVTCAQFSSPLVLAPWAGVMTDRFGGRRTLLATQIMAAAFAAVIAGFVFLGSVSAWVLAFGAVASGLAFTFALPARNVTVRRLVSPADVSPAFAMDSVSYNLGRAVAPPLSVLLVTAFGFGWAFAVNACSFLVFAVCLLLAGSGHDIRRQDAGQGQSRLKDGFVIVARDWEFAVPLLMVAAVTVADDPVLVLGPALAQHQGVSASWPGWFIAALGAGTVFGSFRPVRRAPSHKQAAMALAALAVCMILFVQSPWAWGSLAAAFGAGGGCLIANSSTRSLLASRAGPRREASVMAVWAIAWAGSKPLASLSDGLLAGWVGVKWTGAILAVPALVPFLALTTLMVTVYLTRLPSRWLARSRHRLSSAEWFRIAETQLISDTPMAPDDDEPAAADTSAPRPDDPRPAGPRPRETACPRETDGPGP